MLKELQQRRSAATSVDEPDKADKETIAPDHVDEETTREHLTEAAEMLALMAELAGARLHTRARLG